MKYIKRKSALKPITGSIVDTFNINDKTTNAPSLRLMIDLLYPVGRGFIDFTDTDYSNWLGLTWERELLGMFPVGYNPNDTTFNGIGNKGGEKSHTLTTNEMPSHTHVQNAHYHGSISCGGWTAAIWPSGGGSGQAMNINSSITDWAGNNLLQTNSVTPTNQSTGGSQAHNNLPPYQVVSYWKRVDPNVKTMISFTIDGTSYQAEEGMTWAEWLDSEYNTDDCYYYEEANEIRTKPSYYIIGVSKTDVIIADNEYTTAVSPL